MKIIFIRHGDPDYINDTLTLKGHREAKLLSERVAGWDVKEFYCSPLGRAKDTAEYSLKKMGREAKICPWLKEFYVDIKDPHTGNNRIPWDFLPSYWTKKEELYDKDRWIDSDVMQTGKVKEEYEKVCKGLDKLLMEHGYTRYQNMYRAEKANEDTIVFFCHLGVSFVMLSHLLGISPSVLWQGFFMAPTSVTMLCSEERVDKEAFFRVKYMGDVSHLYAGGETPSDSGFFQEIYK